MTKTTTYNILRFIVPIALVLLASRQSFAISPVLCEPRIGDRLDVDILAGGQAFADTSRLCPVLREASVSAKQTLGVWKPLPDDTLSFAYLSLGAELDKLTKSSDGLKTRFEQRPGNKRTFDGEMPYGIAERGYSCQLSSTGTHDAMTRYRTEGQVDVMVHTGLFMVDLEGDTVWNVACTEYAVTDSIYYSDSDTCFHTSVLRQWYAPGYRYPLLVYRKDVIRNLETDIPDSSEKWYACRRDTQEEKITDDPVNEEIRRTIAESNSPDPGAYRNRPGRTEDSGLPPFLKRDGDGIVVSGSLADGPVTGVILCDIKGCVYDAHKFGDKEIQYRIDCSRLVSGEVYILYVQSDNESYVYRFKA